MEKSNAGAQKDNVWLVMDGAIVRKSAIKSVSLQDALKCSVSNTDLPVRLIVSEIGTYTIHGASHRIHATSPEHARVIYDTIMTWLVSDEEKTLHIRTGWGG